MKPKYAIAGCLTMMLICSASAADSWAHFGICKSQLFSTASANGDSTKDEEMVDWLGRHGWELAAIEPDGCASEFAQRDGKKTQSLYWFKAKGQPSRPKLPPK